MGFICTRFSEMRLSITGIFQVRNLAMAIVVEVEDGYNYSPRSQS